MTRGRLAMGDRREREIERERESVVVMHDGEIVAVSKGDFVAG